MMTYYILWILIIVFYIYVTSSHEEIELRNNKLLKNHKNNLGVKAKGDLYEIKGLIKHILIPDFSLFM